MSSNKRFWRSLRSFFHVHPRYLIFFKFAFIFGLFWLVSFWKLDPDFGWHLQAGNYIRHHGIPAHDVFTYTARNFAWIDHEWGNDVIDSLLYGLGGYALLASLFAGLWTAALFINGQKARLAILFLAAAAMLPYAGIRAIAWSAMLFAGLLNLLSKTDKRPKWAIPLLMLLWANLHGGFILGLAVIAYFAIKRKRVFGLYVLLISVLATFINPYGPRLYEEIARTLFDSSLHFEIDEWHYFSVPPITLIFISLWAAGFWVYRRKPLSNWLSLNFILFASVFSATRNAPLFAVAAYNDLETFYNKFKAELPDKFPKAKLATVVVILGAIFGWVIHLTYGYITELPRYNRQLGYPTQAVAYLKDRPCPGPIFNYYDYGGYLIWKLPGAPVYIDGRMSSWRDSQGEKYVTRYLRLLDNESLQKAEFSRYKIRCALVPSGLTSFIKSLKKQHWHEVVKDSSVTLLEI